MNLRHTAELALVGWYLMSPPPAGDPKYGYLVHAPLSEFISEGAFETLKECEAAQQVFFKTWGDPAHPDSSQTLMAVYTTCIASDDPRLKGN
jgi:hypothetical protein